MSKAPWYVAEVSRKVLHVGSAVIPLSYVLIGDKVLMLRILLPLTVLAVLIEVARHNSAAVQRAFQRTVGFMFRQTEWDRVTGATYVMLGALLTVWLFPRNVAIAVLLILSLADTAASLIGLHYGRSPFIGKKTFAGSFAFFLTALAILWIALPGARGVGFVAALCAAAFEALPPLHVGRFELNDNLVVPLLTGAVIGMLHSDLAPVHLVSVLRAVFSV